MQSAPLGSPERTSPSRPRWAPALMLNAPRGDLHSTWKTTHVEENVGAVHGGL